MVAKEQRIIGLSVTDLNEAIDSHLADGFRLDMIRPADDPIEAWVSDEDFVFHLHKRLKPHRFKGVTSHAFPPVVKSEWHTGRAGMEYRDLIPDRLGGKVIASHIRLTTGGEVPDYVHYHKVDFQMIYCKAGRIKVVYEDQGEPFWLETGDCVLQPPEIRHRVLECTAGAEVIEVSMPAEHETWVEHDITLPTVELKPDRDFSGQRFVRHRPNEPTDTERDTGISAATNGLADVRIKREGAADKLLLLTLRGFGAESNGLLPAPVTFEIAV